MVDTILVLGVLCVGVVVRARWMFGFWQTLLFGGGLAMVVGALIGASAAADEAENPHMSGDLFASWHFWLGLVGALTVSAVIGWWWLQQHRLTRFIGRSTGSSRGQELGLGRGAEVQCRKARILDWGVVLLLPIGGLVPFVGWFVVMMLLWTSRVWTHREKLLATLAIPGGPFVAGLLVDAVLNLHVGLLAKLPLLAATIPLVLLPTAAAVLLAVRARSRAHAVAAGVFRPA